MDSDFVVGINKSIDAAKGETGKTYPAYLHNTVVTEKLDELAEAISEGSGGASALSDLTDVDISGPVQGGKVLKYNAVEEKWAPGDDAGNVQSDWNENDPSSGAYILNKPNVSTKMDKVNPAGSGSLSLNRKSGTTVGINSVAVGINTTASGHYSYAEGNQTTASGQYSHAQGDQTTASGEYSLAQGQSTTASGRAAHAEGAGTTASGAFSHAEGTTTTASASCSHAEGSGATASGDVSHAEGLSTIAASRYQHAGGKYNIEDNNNTYAEIIGNGTGSRARSNARTLDWQGNEVLAGDLTINGNTSVGTTLSNLASAIPDDISDLDDVDTTGATDGQLLGYNGTTHKWVPVTGGGGSSITVLPGTLTAGTTSITFTDARILADSIVSCATPSGINPTAMTSSDGEVTFYFASQASDITVKAVIF